jgi:hypothetical protein
MRWRIRRIVNGCAAQQLVARRDVIAPEFISYGQVIRVVNRKLCLKQGLTNRCSCPPERNLLRAAVVHRTIALC